MKIWDFPKNCILKGLKQAISQIDWETTTGNSTMKEKIMALGPVFSHCTPCVHSPLLSWAHFTWPPNEIQGEVIIMKKLLCRCRLGAPQRTPGPKLQVTPHKAAFPSTVFILPVSRDATGGHLEVLEGCARAGTPQPCSSPSCLETAQISPRVGCSAQTHKL